MSAPRDGAPDKNLTDILTAERVHQGHIVRQRSTAVTEASECGAKIRRVKRLFACAASCTARIERLEVQCIHRVADELRQVALRQPVI